MPAGGSLARWRLTLAQQEITMSGKKTLIALSVAIALGTFGAASVAQACDHADNAKWYPQDNNPGPPISTIRTFGGNAYGFVPPHHAHYNSKERIRGR